jgi:hypothetical protein
VNAAATVFAAQMETTRHHVIKPTLASGGTEVLIVGREMTKSVHEALLTEKKQ